MAESWALFDRLADQFDTVVPFFAEFAAEMVTVLDPPPGTRLLDLGTGRGAVAVVAAARGCVVTAVDAAPTMVRLLAAEHPDLDTRVMDIQTLDLPDAGFDLATAAFVIHLVDDPAKVLGEALRVLRPGGTVALTLPGPCDDGGRWDAFHAVVREFEPLATGPNRPGRPVSAPDLLRDAGFVELRESRIEVHLPVPDPETCWRYQMSHGFAGFVEALSPVDAERLRERLLAELTVMQASGGISVDRGAIVYRATAPEHTR